MPFWEIAFVDGYHCTSGFPTQIDQCEQQQQNNKALARPRGRYVDTSAGDPGLTFWRFLYVSSRGWNIHFILIRNGRHWVLLLSPRLHYSSLILQTKFPINFNHQCWKCRARNFGLLIFWKVEKKSIVKRRRSIIFFQTIISYTFMMAMPFKSIPGLNTYCILRINYKIWLIGKRICNRMIFYDFSTVSEKIW